MVKSEKNAACVLDNVPVSDEVVKLGSTSEMTASGMISAR